MITLSPTPVVANAALASADITALIAAISNLVALPAAKTWADVAAVSVTVQPTGAGVLNVRFTA